VSDSDKDDATPAPAESPPKLSAFIETHCMTCAAGWTRHGKGGGVIVVCLLDREKVWSEMLDCDRYEPAEDRAAPMATLSQETPPVSSPGLPKDAPGEPGKAAERRAMKPRAGADDAAAAPEASG
jgi:hypothetical protein